MKFGLCYLAILDYGAPFKDAFVTMCQVLNLKYDFLAKRNQKELTVEYLHRFLNNNATIIFLFLLVLQLVMLKIVR